MTVLDAGQMLFAASVLMLGVCAWYWPRSRRADVLAAIIIIAIGSAGRELVQELAGGLYAWPEWAVQIAACFRLVQVAGTCLFVRAVTYDRYREKGWIGFLALVGLYAWVR